MPRPGVRLAAGLLGLCLVLMGSGEAVFAQDGAAQTSFKRPSPYPNLARTEQVLTTVALDLVLTLGYVEQTAEAGMWKTAGLPGLGLQRYFKKDLADAQAATLELAAAQNPTGQYDLYVYGERAGPEGAAPNPDLPVVQARVDALFKTLAAAGPPRVGPADLAYSLYTLSYTNSDRVLATLKALGYDAIEYSQTKGAAADSIYYPSASVDTLRTPYVVKLMDATKTSLLQPQLLAPPHARTTVQEVGLSTVPDLGGTYLDQMTSGEPPQRLLIVYDENDIEARDHLLRLLEETIDQPAHQVVIEALVIELNEEALSDLGVTFSGAGDQVGFELQQNQQTGRSDPFLFSFDTSQPDFAFALRARLSALVDKGAADVLSNPSVLVLDGRQARIQVVQQVPITTQVVTINSTAAQVTYLPVGIVLNLRPRISEDRSEITMQVETIVSSIAAFTSLIDVASAPVIDNRHVQTFVRVFDKTPFIIGGLISRDTFEQRTGVPVLSKIPLLGWLFRHTTVSTVKKEVIVVLTPHVIPRGERSVSHVIPKDDDRFNSVDKTLFRNTYRLRRDDVFDLDFVKNSDAVQALRDTVETLVAAHPHLAEDADVADIRHGAIPGEEILVQRMLYEVVIDALGAGSEGIDSLGYEQFIDPEKIFFFGDNLEVCHLQPYLNVLDRKTNTLGVQQRCPDLDTAGWQRDATDGASSNALALIFGVKTDASGLNPPVPQIHYEHTLADTYRDRVQQLNTGEDKTAIIISDVEPRRADNRFSCIANAHKCLKAVLVMKRLLDVNETLKLTLRDFVPGRQIVFPNKVDLTTRKHLIDTEAAHLFYNVFNYYGAFEDAFSQGRERLLTQLNARVKALEEGRE